MSKVDIIAEIGLNHDGSFEKAVKMILVAKATGVKIVKFQHYDALKLLGPDSPYLQYATACQFTKDQLNELALFANQVGMEFMCSVFDISDVVWVDALCKRHKVASRMNQDIDFMNALLKTGKEVIISIDYPASQHDLFGDSQIRLMYCITKYPTPAKDLENLPCNKYLGLSSHCPDIKPTLQAIAQGATIVEHHVTFDRNGPGCDHSSSITFDELRQLQLFGNELEVLK